MPDITVLQLDHEVPLDRFDPWLRAAGARVQVVRVFETAVPSAGELGDGLLVLGGRMSAHDAVEHPWLPDVGALLVETVAADIPTLGICLGHQVLAEALGGEVMVAHPGGGESGAVELSWAEAAAGDPVLGGAVAVGRRAPHSHRDAVTRLPAGAQRLASSAAYPFQAFRVGSALGVQFHPEARPELVGRWKELAGIDPIPVIADLAAADDEIVAVGRAIAEGFARTCSDG